MGRFSDRYPEWADETPSGVGSKLRIHIFGPYRGQCKEILEGIAVNLRNRGYNQANLCIDLPPREKPSTMEKPEYNWLESVHCMDHADVAVFLFLEPSDDRLNKNNSPPGLNSSVIAEFVFWSHFFSKENKEELVIFEGSTKDHLGSLITGIVQAEGLETYDIEFDGISDITKRIANRAIDWSEKYTYKLKSRQKMGDN